MSENTNMIGQQIGNYCLNSLLGHGGFADVYLGTHVYLNTQAAIKLLHTELDEEGIEAFRNESLTIAHLIHPHIVRVLDFDVENNNPFLVMDYAPNGSLRQRHPKGTRLPSATIVSYVKQIASALQYAHDQKLIHRDVKPGNMLLGHNNEVLLSDFGIALVSQSSRSQQTEDVVIGTMSYMAPEQIQGKARPASDQYSLAAVVYEWFCGAKLFRGSYIELVTQHLSASPQPFSEHGVQVPPAVEQVVFRALSKDYHQRFPRVQDFANALEQAYQTPQVFAPVQAAPPAPRQSFVLPPPLATQQAQIQTPIEPMQVRKPSSASPIRATYTDQTPPVTTFPSLGISPQATSVIRKTGRIVRRGVITFFTVMFLLILALCGGSYAVYHYFTMSNTVTASNGVPAATTKADDFVNAIASHNYDHAYSDLAPSLSNQTSRSTFIQQVQQEDTCYGAVSGDNRVVNNTTAQGNSFNYVYNLTRSKMTQPYQLTVTLQQDDGGNWQVTDYHNNITSVQSACS
jgi:serine/threonine protein kinase